MIVDGGGRRGSGDRAACRPHGDRWDWLRGRHDRNRSERCDRRGGTTAERDGQRLGLCGGAHHAEQQRRSERDQLAGRLEHHRHIERIGLLRLHHCPARRGSGRDQSQHTTVGVDRDRSRHSHLVGGLRRRRRRHDRNGGGCGERVGHRRRRRLCRGQGGGRGQRGEDVDSTGSLRGRVEQHLRVDERGRRTCDEDAAQRQHGGDAHLHDPNPTTQFVTSGGRNIQDLSKKPRSVANRAPSPRNRVRMGG